MLNKSPNRYQIKNINERKFETYVKSITYDEYSGKYLLTKDETILEVVTISEVKDQIDEINNSHNYGGLLIFLSSNIQENRIKWYTLEGIPKIKNLPVFEENFNLEIKIMDRAVKLNVFDSEKRDSLLDNNRFNDIAYQRDDTTRNLPNTREPRKYPKTPVSTIKSVPTSSARSNSNAAPLERPDFSSNTIL
uniref:PH domain-containing protein n=1 Tax=Strongyloides papillosus TaxID=174720 RepID=A0A0N5CHJ9_STREA